MPFTAAELEAIQIADAEIDRDFDVADAHSQEYREIERWMDEQIKIDRIDNQALSRKRRQKAYREAHKDEIAAYQRRIGRQKSRAEATAPI